MDRGRHQARVKILRIIARLNIGGPARHVTLLNAGLDARGHHTLLVHGSVGADEGSLDDLTARSGIRAIMTPNLGRSIKALGDVRAFMFVVKAIFRETPDVIHTHTAKAGALGRIAAFAFNATRGRARRCLVVHTYHGHVLDSYFPPLATGVVRATERALARITDRIVAISELQRRDLVERLHVAAAAQTVVVPLGLDLDRLFEIDGATPDLRRSIQAAPDDVIVGCVGRLVDIKDAPTLVRAFAIALKRMPNLRLLIAGDGSARSGVERLVAELGISTRVRFLGWITELQPLYATIDICALSSINEGTPVALIEAMAAGKPVVATTVGGVPDVVTSDVGLLVPPRSPERLADALLRLAADAPLRVRLGGAGRERARSQYSHTRLVENIERLYERGLDEKRRRVPN
jgi:glycosyltransferase involved in cell wall biosynthesis